MDDSQSKSWGGCAAESLLPRQARRKWTFVRLAAVVLLLVVFRYEALAWLIGGGNLLWKLSSGEPVNNATCVAALARLHGPGLHMLVRIGEARWLGLIDDAAALPALLAMAHDDPDPDARAGAVLGLRNFPDARAVPAIIQAIDDRDPRVRLAAARDMAEVGDPRFAPLIEQAALRETDARVRRILAMAKDRLPPGTTPGATRPAGVK